jgi:hypothetical protein
MVQNVLDTCLRKILMDRDVTGAIELVLTLGFPYLSLDPDLLFLRTKDTPSKPFRISYKTRSTCHNL